MFGKISLFLSESREELKRVNWPNRQETMRMVLIVVTISLIVAAFLGTLDFLFLSGIQKLII
ncbi:MAG: preprotein translocase subunit SecE [Candidatus Colwellbacteria bacterium]|nr:preprotein translocase subunit SecE [Candidatus Colwellbacteria bacterium]